MVNCETITIFFNKTLQYKDHLTLFEYKQRNKDGRLVGNNVFER